MYGYIMKTEDERKERKMNYTGCTEREWKENVEYFKAHGWTFDKWFDYGHAYGLKKRQAREIWNRF